MEPAIVCAMLMGAGAFAQAQDTVDARSSDGLAYDLVGEGPLVVLIHGTNLDRRMWDAEVGWLREQVRVLRFDLRGQGGSDFPTEPFSNHEDLIDLLSDLGEADVTLVGLSAGTQVALDVALAAPGACVSIHCWLRANGNARLPVGLDHGAEGRGLRWRQRGAAGLVAHVCPLEPGAPGAYDG